MTKNQIGLVCGLFLAIGHAAWSLVVAIIPGTTQQFINWFLSIHRVTTPVMILPFDLTSAITLLIFTFIVGFIFGWIVTWLVRVVRRR